MNSRRLLLALLGALIVSGGCTLPYLDTKHFNQKITPPSGKHSKSVPPPQPAAQPRSQQQEQK
jgi:hypothetical protein